MPRFANFTFKNVNIVFGILEIEGYGNGDDVVSIEQDVDQFTKIVGAKGDLTRIQTNDASCLITVKLLQTSVSNPELNTLYLTDRATGAGALPMVINNKEAGESFSIPNSWIVKFPRVVRGQGVNLMEWVFAGDDLIPLIQAP